VKLYLIAIHGDDGYTETPVESDNRGVKGGAVPAHVVEYAHALARSIPGARTVEIGRHTPPLLSGSGVGRHAVTVWQYRADVQ